MNEPLNCKIYTMTFFYILVLYLMKYNIYFIVCVNPLPLFTSHLRLVCCMAYFYILLCICYYLSHLIGLFSVACLRRALRSFSLTSPLFLYFDLYTLYIL